MSHDLEIAIEPQLAAFARSISPPHASAARKLSAVVVGLLPPETLIRLQEHRGTVGISVTKLKAKHHTLARLLAQGESQTDAAIITRYDVAHVTALMKSPAFLDLVRFYANREDKNNQALQEKMSNVSIDAIDALHSRLEDEPEAFTAGELLEIVKTTADRTGHGPSSTKKVDVNVGFAERLQAARTRVQTYQAQLPVIEGEILSDD